MPTERWRQVEEIFQLALERPMTERAGFLASACDGDRTLRTEVDSLIEAHQQPNDLLETMNFAVSPLHFHGWQNGSWVGRKVGPYTLLRELGRGGMSTVYLATRADRELERQVALKLVGQGNHPLLVERFRTERRILATLDHPNIARLYDGGTTEGGFPYFVMENVEGRPIDRYCDTKRLGTAERLELFRRVCGAVQYAHQNLVVHRDIKPSNILVTPDGTPKLLDFGIAKLLEPDASADSGETTLPGLCPMTPRYASPEQLQGEAITTASDVYSLGVLLFKLLTGRLPYPDETLVAESVDRRHVPPKPSAAVASTGEVLRRQLAGDVDSIVLQALRWEPHQRYRSVEQLTEDVRRHLEGLPVKARRAGWRYRAGKFVRRNKLAVATVVGFVALALASAITMAVLTARVVHERDRARQEQDRTHQVVTFLVDLFEVTEVAGNVVSARELLKRGVQSARELDVEPEQRAALYDILGAASLKLGLYDQAMPLLEEALEMRRQIFGAEHPNVGESLYHLAELLTMTGDYPRAEVLLREAVGIQHAVFGDETPELARSLRQLAWLLSVRGEYGEAETLNRNALAMQRRLLGEEHPEVANSLTELAAVLYDKRDLEGAESLFREALALKRRFGEESQGLAVILRSLALVLLQKGDLEPAEPLFREALAIGKRVFGDEHPEIASIMGQLAMLLQLKGDPETAERLCRDALAMRRKLLGDEHPRVGWTLKDLAWLLHRQGELEAAESLYHESLKILREGLPEGSLYKVSPLIGLGLLLIERGDPRSAEPRLREALAIRREATPESISGIARAQIALGGCLLALDRLEEAQERLVEGYAMLESQPEHREWDQREWTLRALRNLVEIYRIRDEPEKVDEYRSLLRSVEAG